MISRIFGFGFGEITAENWVTSEINDPLDFVPLAKATKVQFLTSSNSFSSKMKLIPTVSNDIKKFNCYVLLVTIFVRRL